MISQVLLQLQQSFTSVVQLSIFWEWIEGYEILEWCNLTSLQLCIIQWLDSEHKIVDQKAQENS
jgi:hypothetical protein